MLEAFDTLFNQRDYAAAERFSGFGAPVNWIAADIVRIQNGILVEHGDVIENEATEEQSVRHRTIALHDVLAAPALSRASRMPLPLAHGMLHT